MSGIQSLPVDLGLRPLKVLLAGPPDVGKSTLIGRLLVDNNAIFIDQVQEDLAFHTDGLLQERADGMTIDVTFKTLHLRNSGHRVVVIDSPGHTEYLHNFLCGLSAADIVLHLVDSTRPTLKSEHIDLIEHSGKPYYTIMTKWDSISEEERSILKADFKIDSIAGLGIEELEAFLQSAASHLPHHSHY